MEEKNQTKALTVLEAYALAPNKHTVFFGAGGITTTLASHYAELIKANALSINAEFSRTAAFHGIMDFKGKEVEVDLFRTIDLEGLATKEGEMYALSAWLREAVKAKDSLIQYFKTVNYTDLLVEGVLPVFTENRPTPKSIPAMNMLKDEDILGNFNVAERADYYKVEAKAAHLGIKIHPKGVIYNIKAELEKGRGTGFKALPDGSGESTFLVNYEALYDLETIRSIYFRLQAQHKSAESSLNHYKALIKNAVTEGNAKLQQEYTNLVRSVSTEYQKELAGYNARLEAHDAEIGALISDAEKLRLELIKYVSQLKVIIPKDLEYIVKEIADLSA